MVRSFHRESGVIRKSNEAVRSGIRLSVAPSQSDRSCDGVCFLNNLNSGKPHTSGSDPRILRLLQPDYSRGRENARVASSNGGETDDHSTRLLYPCVSHMAKTTSDSQQETTKRKLRRTSAELRNTHLENGAFLVEFKTPDEPMNLFRRVPPLGISPKSLLSGSAWQSAMDAYRTMERKGFCVTTDLGCLIPHPQYSTYQHGATRKGHQRTFAFFARWTPEKMDVRNEFGWPCSVQISHLCHRRSCARADHLVAEEQWRNLKRNYCGINGECDCGNEIKCLRRYQAADQCENPPFCKSADEVKEALKDAPVFVIHGKDRFLNRDRKANQRLVNRRKRKRKQALHAYRTKRKQLRLARKSDASM